MPSRARRERSPIGKVCNFEQTAGVRFRYASAFLRSKGVPPDQSLQKGNGRDTFQRCDVLLFGGVESHRFLFSGEF